MRHWKIDGSLLVSPSLVVGHTLSAYFAGDVQNGQETLTLTVYNQQADPITGVLLTDTLASGVTFSNASIVPNQSGQSLSWNLGTIEGFEQVTVTVTLSLPGLIPLQLDNGAQATGTLDAAAASANTPIAALRVGNLTDRRSWHPPSTQIQAILTSRKRPRSWTTTRSRFLISCRRISAMNPTSVPCVVPAGLCGAILAIPLMWPAWAWH